MRTPGASSASRKATYADHGTARRTKRRSASSGDGVGRALEATIVTSNVDPDGRHRRGPPRHCLPDDGHLIAAEVPVAVLLASWRTARPMCALACTAVDFVILGPLLDVETIATGSGIRERRRLRKRMDGVDGGSERGLLGFSCPGVRFGRRSRTGTKRTVWAARNSRLNAFCRDAHTLEPPTS